jgi:hypothetical protein
MTNLKNSNSFEMEKPQNIGKNGIFISKIQLILVILLVCGMLIAIPLTVFHTKSDVNFDKIIQKPSLTQQAWNDICINYACDNNDKLNGKF